MYERFTGRAREVMRLANEEAERWNHEYIGTEHMLLGLIKEGSGVGASVLKNMVMDLKRIEQDIEKLVRRGPGKITMNKYPQTPRAKKVIEYAISQALNLNHNYVGTEHLLLGLLQATDSVGAQVLGNQGVTLQIATEQVKQLVEAGPHIPDAETGPSDQLPDGEP